jgi:prepilin-type N-terminal cleavage/methylation domain-containing protein
MVIMTYLAMVLMAKVAAREKMPTSIVGNKFFTLVELVCVLAVIAIASSLAIATFRDKSPQQVLTTASLELESFISQVQFRAAETGKEWSLKIDKDNNQLIAEIADNTKGGTYGTSEPILSEEDLEKIDEVPEEELDDSSEENSSLYKIVKPQIKPLVFKFPEKLEFDFPTTIEDEDSSNSLAINEQLELFRFYPDGMGSGNFILTLKSGSLTSKFELSSFTGKLKKATENNEEK